MKPMLERNTVIYDHQESITLKNSLHTGKYVKIGHFFRVKDFKTNCFLHFIRGPN